MTFFVALFNGPDFAIGVCLPPTLGAGEPLNVPLPVPAFVILSWRRVSCVIPAKSFFRVALMFPFLSRLSCAALPDLPSDGRGLGSTGGVFCLFRVDCFFSHSSFNC